MRCSEITLNVQWRNVLVFVTITLIVRKDLFGLKTSFTDCNRQWLLTRLHSALVFGDPGQDWVNHGKLRPRVTTPSAHLSAFRDAAPSRDTWPASEATFVTFPGARPRLVTTDGDLDTIRLWRSGRETYLSAASLQPWKFSLTEKRYSHSSFQEYVTTKQRVWSWYEVKVWRVIQRSTLMWWRPCADILLSCIIITLSSLNKNIRLTD